MSDRRPKLHVLLRQEELDSDRIAGAVAVVIDVLFATTTIATTLHHGATEVIPVLDEAEARALAGQYTAGAVVLAGEKDAYTLPGFASPLPLTLVRAGVAGKPLIYCTTNGTVAVRRASQARAVYTAAVVNGAAVARQIAASHAAENVVIICAGSAGTVNLEDVYGAGLLVEQVQRCSGEGWHLTDAARVALGLYEHGRSAPEACLRQARIGRLITAWGHGDEVRYAAQVGSVPVVPVLLDGRLRPVVFS